MANGNVFFCNRIFSSSLNIPRYIRIQNFQTNKPFVLYPAKFVEKFRGETTHGNCMLILTEFTHEAFFPRKFETYTPV